MVENGATIDDLVENVFAFKTIKQALRGELAKQFGRIPIDEASKVAKEICYGDVSNPVAYAYRRAEEFLQKMEEARIKKEFWKTAAVDCMSGQFFSDYIALIDEIILWHQDGLVQKNPEGNTIPMTVEEWVDAGRPKSWSPIVDNMMEGSYAAYLKDKELPGFLHQYFKSYLVKLQTLRKKRTEERFESNRLKALEQARRMKEVSHA